MPHGVPAVRTHHPFSWQSIQKHPKLMSRLDFAGHTYEIRHANGFVKVYTVKGIAYWSFQTQYGNRFPDWKLHFSIDSQDRWAAWNILIALFIERKCEFSMKIQYGEWPPHMRGREITVYIFSYHPLAERVLIYDPASRTERPVLSAADDRPGTFWRDFVSVAESRLARAKIRPAPLAQGDLPLGRYCSLRNEAFVRVGPEWRPPSSGWAGYDQGAAELHKCQWVYPENNAGWNAARHPVPFLWGARSRWGYTVEACLPPQKRAALRRWAAMTARRADAWFRGLMLI
ncbi:hypothetical protein PAPYR_5724 [Paratrimastix pyriformis]|uniref:Uncharacterized protein n=1 Tax=Paratrimastix pyriformis TaxID=342808 RepID=A0ABQ8UJD9_9EUKA|nr:hypothetical protein PAPYR_5724 [Paratrimastix pyriformis]